MFEYLQRMLSERGLAPHGYCLLWDPALIWTNVLADAVTGLSYFSIPLVIARFLTKRRDVQFSWVVWLFATFIMACGATHFISIFVLWVPAYGIEALVKLATAIVSMITAATLWPLLPKAIALPSPVQLQSANDALEARVKERDEALRALERETVERQRTEEMLRQSQKMEAVGHLTGGIAHDFNNLLTAVVANLDRVQRLGGLDERLEKCIRNAMSGADRAAKLTDQLLSFSRKQPLQPEPQQVNAIVEGMHDLLERTLGAEIELRLILESDLPLIIVDKNQTENALLNLAINARDAMPQGGILSITTSQLDSQVLLSVRDTGEGMEADVLVHVFEPFFTTKPVGQGTGLGLSQVYGFTKQSEGDILIASEPGLGTTITMKLPVVATDSSTARNYARA